MSTILKLWVRRMSSYLLPTLLLLADGGLGAIPPLPVTTGLPSETGAAGSLTPLLSSDGRVVVFSSLASDLVTNDFNHALDVFRYEVDSGRLSLVSENQSRSAAANGRSVAVDISTNGQWVLFESSASDIVSNDTNGVPDLFLCDMVSGETKGVSLDRDGILVGGFRNASLSADGRFVLFDSAVPNLVTNPFSGAQVYVRDLQAGANFLVSVSTNEESGGNWPSYGAVMTPDARWIAFQSQATSLVTNDPNTRPDVYLRDMQAGTTVLVSVNRQGVSSPSLTGTSKNPSISDDGRYIAFESTATDLATNSIGASVSSVVYVRDALAGSTTFVSEQTDAGGSAARPVISADGRFIAYESLNNIYCWDLSQRHTFLLSTNYSGTGGANAPCHSAQFTPDNRYCFFLSSATNLVAAGTRPDQCQVYRRDMQTGEIILVAPGSAADIVDGGWISCSDDGNNVAFQSASSDLATNDYNASPDVFLANISGGSVGLISKRNLEVKSLTDAGTSGIGPNCLSADGRYLLFWSSARIFPNQETTGFKNLVVRDLWTGSNQLVTAACDGSGCALGLHYAASISGNGRWVVFQSSATNLVANDTNNCSDIFVRDLWAGTNYLVSVPHTGAGFANSNSLSPAISDDGRFVTFQSLASDLVSGDPPSTLDAFLRDMAEQKTIALSTMYNGTAPAGGQIHFGNGASNIFTPKLTPDGSWAVIWSRNNLSTNSGFVTAPYSFARNAGGLMVPIGIYTNGSIYTANRGLTLAPGGRFGVFETIWLPLYNMIGVYDFAAQTNYLAVTGSSGSASLSADGRWLAFEGRASNFGTNSGNTVADIFLLDRASNAIRLVSYNPSSKLGGNGPSVDPLVSADGRYVVFKSKATDLVASDTNGVSDIFVADLTTGSALSLSCNPDGSAANRVSGNAILGPDGRTVVFESFASNLAPGDLNESKDVFVLRLPGDTAAEFRILTLTSIGTGAVKLFWNSVPGKTYRVEYQETISNPSWAELPGDILATSYVSSKTDSFDAPGQSRFYRVRIVSE